MNWQKKWWYPRMYSENIDEHMCTENIEDSSQFSWITNQYLELQRSPVLNGWNYSKNHYFAITRLGWYPKLISKQVQPLISMDWFPPYSRYTTHTSNTVMKQTHHIFPPAITGTYTHSRPPRKLEFPASGFLGVMRVVTEAVRWVGSPRNNAW